MGGLNIAGHREYNLYWNLQRDTVVNNLIKYMKSKEQEKEDQIKLKIQEEKVLLKKKKGRRKNTKIKR